MDTTDLSDLFKQSQKSAREIIPIARWQVTTGSFGALVKDAPNRFHRFMQKLVFGFHWRKL